MRYLLLALLVGCGDPLVGPSFLGTPSFELGGTVDEAAAGAFAAQDKLRLSLFWIGFDSREHARPVVEQRAAIDQGLGTFRMTLFGAPPPDAVGFDAWTPDGVHAGVALIVLYADNNENEALNSYSPDPNAGPDIVVGASATHLVAYADAPIPAEAPLATMLGTLEPGYHLFENVDGSTCAFTDTTGCRGAGRLTRVDPKEARVALRLSGNRAAVLVPNPAVPRGSVSGTNENLYNSGRD